MRSGRIGTALLTMSIAACGGRTRAVASGDARNASEDGPSTSDAGITRIEAPSDSGEDATACSLPGETCPTDASDSGDDSAPCSLPSETCPGSCVASGGTCYPCRPPQATLSCGALVGGDVGLYCCTGSEAGIVLLTGPDGAPCYLPGETCPGCLGGCVAPSCVSEFPPMNDWNCGESEGGPYCCLPLQ